MASSNPPTAPSDGPETADAPGEAQLLVSEFPPPPYYYRQAATATGLSPPPIPVDALKRGTRKAAAAAARARAEAERQRLGSGDHDYDKTGAILGGVVEQKDSGDPDEEGEVVAVFGEIVEDPLCVEPLDACEDPTVIGAELKRLNQQVLQGFVKLVQDLVHRPTENKKTRDELSHNIFLMIQECNKFREHQAREILIELMEKQLAERKRLLKELQSNIDQANALLNH